MIEYLYSAFVFSSVIHLAALQLSFVLPSTLPPQSKEFIDVGFFFHSRAEPNVDKNYRVSAYNLTSLRNSSFDPNKKTKFLAHGFTQSAHRPWVKNMTAALLQYGDYNIFRVDWEKGAVSLLDQAVANTKTVGEEIAYFINTLKANFNFDSAKGHCIGHSMGSYVCAHAGQRIGTLGNITGLDPAPVQLANMEKDEILDPSDAMFVDAIHTGMNILNILPNVAIKNPVGNVDIYVNGGDYQDGCRITLEGLLNTTNNQEGDPHEIIINEGVCGHFRVISYYLEAIWNPSCEWVAYECENYELFLQGQCASCGADNLQCVLFGPRVEEYPAKSRENVRFFIKTADESPFCVHHYVVNISTTIIDQSESPSGGEIVFEIIGNNGNFKDKFEISGDDHGQAIKSLFVHRTDVGQISSVKLTWKNNDFLLGLLFDNSYVLGVNKIEVYPMSHYPGSEPVTACRSSECQPTPVEDGETKTFPVSTNC